MKSLPLWIAIVCVASGCELVVGDEDRRVAADGEAPAGDGAVVADAAPAADAGAPREASTPDAPAVCTAPAHCATEATACAAKCVHDYVDCCKPPDCKPDCATKQDSCKVQCVAKCDACDGCADAHATCVSAAK